MNTVTAVRDRILQLCAERGISINRLASLSALPPSSLKNILYGKSQNPKILTIKLLCDGLGITLGEFFSTRWSRSCNNVCLSKKSLRTFPQSRPCFGRPSVV